MPSSGLIGYFLSAGSLYYTYKLYQREEDLWVNYRLADGSQSPYAASMLGNLQHWLDNEESVAGLLERLPEIRRENICKN